MQAKEYKAVISGMHCAACSSRIERVVGKMAGVLSCSVNLATTKAAIDYDGDIVTTQELEQAIAGLGFGAEPIAEDQDSGNPDELANRELAAMQRRLWPLFSLGLFIMVLAMGPMLGIVLPDFINPEKAPLSYAALQLFLLLPVLYFGRSFYLSGIPALLRGGPNMDSLIAIGTGAAVIYSTWNLVEISLGHVHKVHDLYFESAAMLLALISLGKYLEARAKSRTSDAIRQLIQLTPDTATLLVDGKSQLVAVQDIKVGDTVLIRPGERIPVDGRVVDGSSAVDESMLTGESMPVSKEVDNELFSGTLNSTGSLTMVATKIGKQTMLARIIKLVQDAQGAKAPIANLADRISYYFVPVVISLALIAGLAWYVLGGADFSFSLRIFIAVLVIACPCAMGLATPTSIMVGTGRGAQLGVLIKSGSVLELAEKVSCVVFDKTGTLTVGKPQVTDVKLFGTLREEEVLRLAATAESRSEHPLAAAIIEAATGYAETAVEIKSFAAVPGRGINAELVMGDQDYGVVFGNYSHMRENDIAACNDEAVISEAASLSEEGKTVLYLAANKKIEALLAITDPLKEEAAATLAELRKLGVKIVMLTGDNEKTAHAVAGQAGIEHVIAGVLPDGKEAEIVRLQQGGERVAMVGDGINDAPALARADVGIAMGNGIDVAVESADIVLMSGHLDGVLNAIGLSRATMRNIKQNLFWAFIYNIIGIPVAAGVLAIFGGPTLNPMIGGAAMAMSSVSVVTNALRLRWYSPSNR
jgi:Cu+-exporting ATPase